MTLTEILIGAAVLFVGYRLLNNSSPIGSVPTPVPPVGLVPAFTPPPATPYAAPINRGGAPISSSYAVTSPATTLATLGNGRTIPAAILAYLKANPGATYNLKGGVITLGNGQIIRASSITPTVGASPNVVGGIAGGAGTGGIPLGGAVVPGVSPGTGTTVIPPITFPKLVV